jgi:hypothetical protein
MRFSVDPRWAPAADRGCSGALQLCHDDDVAGGAKPEGDRSKPAAVHLSASPNRATRLARAIGVVPDRRLLAQDQSSGGVGSHLGLPAASGAAELVGRCCDSRGRERLRRSRPTLSNPLTHAAATRATPRAREGKPRAAKANRVAAFRSRGLNVEVVEAVLWSSVHDTCERCSPTRSATSIRSVTSALIVKTNRQRSSPRADNVAGLHDKP